MKKNFILIFAFLMSIFNASAQFNDQTRIGVALIETEGCDCDVQVCLDVCWSETGNCNNQVCAQDCITLSYNPQSPTNPLSAGPELPGGEQTVICSSTLTITVNGCVSTVPLPLQLVTHEDGNYVEIDCACPGSGAPCPKFRIYQPNGANGTFYIANNY